MVKNLNTSVIVFILAFITVLLLAKVHVSNKIYILSRDIQKTMVKIDALKEEQSILKLKTEKLKYINKIVYPLFNENENVKINLMQESEPKEQEQESDNWLKR